jgi:hypothetical protein
MNNAAIRLQRRLGVNDCREIRQIRSHKLGCVFSLATSFGHNDRHGFTDVPHLVMCQEWLPRTKELMLNH